MGTETDFGLGDGRTMQCAHDVLSSRSLETCVV